MWGMFLYLAFIHLGHKDQIGAVHEMEHIHTQTGSHFTPSPKTAGNNCLGTHTYSDWVSLYTLTQNSWEQLPLLGDWRGRWGVEREIKLLKSRAKVPPSWLQCQWQDGSNQFI